MRDISAHGATGGEIGDLAQGCAALEGIAARAGSSAASACFWAAKPESQVPITKTANIGKATVAPASKAMIGGPGMEGRRARAFQRPAARQREGEPRHQEQQREIDQAHVRLPTCHIKAGRSKTRAGRIRARLRPAYFGRPSPVITLRAETLACEVASLSLGTGTRPFFSR